MTLSRLFRWLLLGIVLTSPTLAASLQQVTNFGTNPTNVSMYIYIPENLASKPPILVNPHWCHGDAQSAYSGSQYATLASKYGFIVIYPDSPNLSDKCWDVSSNQTLKHYGGGDSLGIVSMVEYTLEKYNGDPDRVFVTGVSSGAMMTNVLIGAYPDIFAAGSAFAGVPFGCFAGPGFGYWNSDCANGLITHSGPEWAAIVKAAYPSYDDWRPKMQVFHGTLDQVLNYTNFLEEIKQWTAVLGLSGTAASATENTPLPGWTKYVYGIKGTFEAYSAAGVDHNIQNQENIAMAWFDLTCTSGNCYSRSNPNGGSGGVTCCSTTTATRTSITQTTVFSTVTNTLSGTATATRVAQWGQCGGIGYTGPTNCLSGTCHYNNDYYSQCY